MKELLMKALWWWDEGSAVGQHVLAKLNFSNLGTSY